MQSAFDVLRERLDRLGDSESASQREESSPEALNQSIQPAACGRG